MKREERRQLAELHQLSCVTCGPLDTPKRFMAHLYATRGTTFEKELADNQKMVEAVVPVLKAAVKELNIRFAVSHGLPLPDDMT